MEHEFEIAGQTMPQALRALAYTLENDYRHVRVTSIGVEYDSSLHSCYSLKVRVEGEYHLSDRPCPTCQAEHKQRKSQRRSAARNDAEA